MATVFIGFLDEKISTSVTVDALTSKVGGNPAVYGAIALTLKCRSCKEKNCSLVSQIYCPVDEQYHRTLYIFCCTDPQCNRTSLGWQVLRIQHLITEVKSELPTKATSTLLDVNWGTEDADDWGGEDATSGWGDSESIDSSLSVNDTINNPPEAASVVLTDVNDLVGAIDGLSLSSTENGNAFDSYYISVCEDSHSTSTHKPTNQEKQILEAYDKEFDRLDTGKGGAGGATPSGEHYEKTHVAHGDSIFYKFTKALTNNPSQIIRYGYCGRAVPMRSLEASSIPRCENCGTQRVFETQLMPALMQSMTIQGKPIPLDIGTVIIYTCGRNCWNNKVVREHSIVQHDPDEHLLSKKFGNQ